MRKPIDRILLGGALVPVVMWLTFHAVGQPAALWLLLVFQVGLNLPHYFQTYALTYFQPEVRGTQVRRLGAALALAFTLPVAAILLGPGVLAATLALIVLWGFFHITQQTRGLCGLYLRRDGPAGDPTTEAFRRALLSFLFAGSAATAVWRLADWGPTLNDRTAALPSLLPLAAALAAGAAVSLGRALWQWRPGRESALALAIAHVGIFALAISVADLNLVLVLATSWHALQYLALTFSVQTGLPNDSFFPRLARSEVVAFFALALGFGLAAASLGAALPKPWGQAVYLPLLLLHYLNDGWLWKPSVNPRAKGWLAPLATA